MSRRDVWYERAFEGPYLEVYKHRDDQEAERATRCLLEPLGLENRKILDLACGAGRYCATLAARGGKVTGVDLSLTLLRSAQSLHRRSMSLVRGDILELPFQNAVFDLAVSMFTSFGYFADRDQDVGMLHEVWRVLRPGGWFLLDFFNASRVRRCLVPEDVRHVGVYQVHECRHIDEERNLVVKEIELTDAERTVTYREEVRLWGRTDLEWELSHSGFTVVSAWGSYDGEAFQESSSDRLILLTRKPSLDLGSGD